MGVTKADRERRTHYIINTIMILNNIMYDICIDWTMVDAGWLLVHFFSEEGRTLHDVESQVINNSWHGRPAYSHIHQWHVMIMLL